MQELFPFDSYGFAFALAGSSIGRCALPSAGKPTDVTPSTVALDSLKPLQVHGNIPPKIAFDQILTLLNCLSEFGQLLFIQVAGTDVRIDASGFQDFSGNLWTYAIYVAEGVRYLLFVGDLYTNNTSHFSNPSISLVFACDVGFCRQPVLLRFAV
jgi:hypothetical protein